MNIELKPCPFCGGEAKLRESPNSRSEEGMSFYEVRCKKCGVHVTGKSFNFWTVEYDHENPQDQLSAAKRWNKRVCKEDKRKVGKWIREFRTEADFIIGQYSYKCPFCGEYSYSNKKYCSECGSKMEGFVDVSDC